MLTRRAEVEIAVCVCGHKCLFLDGLCLFFRSLSSPSLCLLFRDSLYNRSTIDQPASTARPEEERRRLDRSSSSACKLSVGLGEPGGNISDFSPDRDSPRQHNLQGGEHRRTRDCVAEVDMWRCRGRKMRKCGGAERGYQQRGRRRVYYTRDDGLSFRRDPTEHLRR